MDSNLFHYRAVVTSVYDGDTCTVDIDLGLHIWLRGEKLRLFGINAPEMRGPEKIEGRKSRDYLRSLIDGREIVIKSHRDKKGKYGRYLAELFLLQEDGKWLDINQDLVDQGFAVHKIY